MDNWIKVSERLPEEEQKYYLIYSCIGYNVAYFKVGMFCQIYHNKGYCRVYDKVTHWQPLPEPPKEKEE